MKLNENEKIVEGRLHFTESFDVSKIEYKSIESKLEEGKSTKSKKMAVIPVIEAIHAGRTRNGNIYTAEKLQGNHELQSGVYSFTYPYAKPMLKNHDTSSEPTGRITYAEFAKTSSTGKPAIVIKPEISDPDAIEKVLDGRYLTVSIGATTDAAICNICGTDILAEGFCGHWRNEEYDGVKCGWIAGNLWFDECSWVNVPADSTAVTISVGEVTNTKESVVEGEEPVATEPEVTEEPKVAEGEEDPKEPEVVEPEVTEGSTAEPEAGEPTPEPEVTEGDANKPEEDPKEPEQGEGEPEVTQKEEGNDEGKPSPDKTTEADDNGEENSKNIENVNLEENLLKKVNNELEESLKVVKTLEEELSQEKNLRELKEVEISELNMEINDLREEYEAAQTQVLKIGTEMKDAVAELIVSMKENLNQLNSEEAATEKDVLFEKSFDELKANLATIQAEFKEEMRKRMFSTQVESPYREEVGETTKPLSESALKEKVLFNLLTGNYKK